MPLNKAFVALTHPEWFRSLRQSGIALESEIDFWRSDTQRFNAIRQGEHFYCLLRTPQYEDRQIVAVGEFCRFEILTVQQAWDKYSTATGARDFSELLARLRELYPDVKPDKKIGHIILRNFRIASKPIDFEEMKQIGLEFAKNIVQGKGISEELDKKLFARLVGDYPPLARDAIQVPDSLEPPRRHKTEITRVIRDTALTKELKSQYGWSCQICQTRVKITETEFYAEAHHIRPLGGEHNGLDCKENIIVLCPNHHAAFDKGAIAIDPEELTLIGNDERVGTKITLREGHKLDRSNLKYHLEKIFRGSKKTA